MRTTVHVKRLAQLHSDIARALERCVHLARLAAPAHIDAVHEVDARVRQQALWLNDTVGDVCWIVALFVFKIDFRF